jgi:Mrp family chromosome partitioning ATPase
MVVEADFRRPTLGRLMNLPATRGLADVLAGTASPHVAAQPIDPAPFDGPLAPAARAPGDGAAQTAVRAPTEGALSVLLAGGPVPNPPAALASETMSWLLRSLADEHDQVLIDVPPPLEVSDALPLLPLVDGIILVARAGHTRIASAERLTQLLERTTSAPTLGVVLNCVSQREMERYGFSLGPGGSARWRPFAR